MKKKSTKKTAKKVNQKEQEAINHWQRLLMKAEYERAEIIRNRGGW